MRYFLTVDNGIEKGPYEEAQVLEWLAAGVMPRNAPSRAENEAVARPACEVFPGVAPPLRLDPALEVITSHYDQPEDDPLQPGSFWMGLFFATICSIPALFYLLFASHIRRQTRRGIVWGLVFPLVMSAIALVGLTVQFIATAKR